MQKILLVMLLLILSSCAIAVNDKNIVTVKLNNKMYEIIAKDTIDYLYNMYYSKNIEARINKM